MVYRPMANLFKFAFAFTPISTFTEAIKVEKFWCCWRHDSRYIYFFSLSASCKHVSGVFAEWDLASVFTARIL